jgi:Rrf2 family nitric oxide-sensitive transcriptional repressor
LQLTVRADYSLRVLIYLATRPECLVGTGEIADAFEISKHHLVRVIEGLAGQGFVRIQRGRSGGITLGRPAEMIRLGDVVRASEPNMRLVECFDHENNTCKIAPECGLKGMLREALTSFLESLNQYTVADVVGRSGRETLVSLLGVRVPAADTGSN